MPISEPGVPSEPARHGLPIALALVLIVPLVVVVLLYLLTRFVGPGDSSGKVLARVHAAAIAVLPREVVAYVEAGTGRILTLPESDVALLMGSVPPESAAPGRVALAAGSDGAVYAAWLEGPGHATISEVAPDERIIWRGIGPYSGISLATPPRPGSGSTPAASAAAPDRLVVALAAASGTRGEIFELDPSRGPGSSVVARSTGWNDPTALTIATDGSIWVADDSSGHGAILSTDAAAGDATARAVPLIDVVAPVGIAQASPEEAAVCDSDAGLLVMFRLQPDGSARRETPPLATNCTVGVARLSNAKLVYANDDAIYTIDLTSPF